MATLKLSANQKALLKRVVRARCWVGPSGDERRSAEALLRRGLLEKKKQKWGERWPNGDKSKAEELFDWVYRATTKGETALDSAPPVAAASSSS